MATPGRRRRWGDGTAQQAVPERRAASLSEARALAHPLRLRILRLCLDEELTNKEIAARVGVQPATLLHHVRTLVSTGFLAPTSPRPGPRGTTEKPYRATGKSWRLDVGTAGPAADVHRAMIDAAAAELTEAGPDAVIELSRMAMRLSPAQLQDLERRVADIIIDYGVVDEPGGQPVAMLVVLHRRGGAHR